MSAEPVNPDSTARRPFGGRLAAAMDDHGPLCVGIDPHPGLLGEWGLNDDAEGLRTFSLKVMDAVGGRVAAVKPQSAFFERHGSQGIAVLEQVLAACRDTGTLSILDVKRGDIDSTMTAYGEAYLRDDAPLAADAITVSPFLGVGSLEPALALATRTGRGLFVLCLTSNPDGPSVQHALDATGRSVAAQVAQWVGAANREASGGDGAELGSAGLVVGATIGDGARVAGVDLGAVGGPFLAPGVGAQGGGAAELAAVFGDARRAVLASSSRGVLRAGPGVADLRAAAGKATAEALSSLRP